MDKKHELLTTNISLDIWDFADLILKNRFLKALDEGVSRYSVYRDLRFAARADLETLFDDLALNLGWRVQRLYSNQMILEENGFFVSASGGYKKDYCSCSFHIWGENLESVEQVRQKILERVGDLQILEPMFSIDWHFLTSRKELQNVAIEELADDVLHDQAYPDFKEGLAKFIDSYLNANETVLVLQGPPGTGKTRLIRAILGAMSKRKNGQASALYTGDKQALENDEIFVKFITGWEDAFIIEDADHVLKPRAEGNENLHRFLAIADGVIRAQGRKIIFSTNLPNVKDLDDALIRPGRCFARVSVRELSLAEAESLIATLCGNETSTLAQATQALEKMGKKHYALADVYKVFFSISGK
jgi:ABC-type transport system involved in cytochrome c biogenesis ATPase subunit